MNAPIAAVVLCVFAQVAAAQCLDTTAAAAAGAATTAGTQQQRANPDIIRTSANVKPAATAGMVRGEAQAMRTAAGVTPAAREVAMPRDAAAPTRDVAADTREQRDDSALLWAALALMSGIALRRYSAGSR